MAKEILPGSGIKETGVYPVTLEKGLVELYELYMTGDTRKSP